MEAINSALQEWQRVLDKLKHHQVQQTSSVDVIKQKPTYKCQKCKDQEGYLVMIDGQPMYEQCECRDKKRLQKMLQSSNITADFQKKTFGNFVDWSGDARHQELYQKGYTYAKDFEEIQKKEEGHSLGLVGASGSGKSHVAFAVANNLMVKKGIQVLYFNFVNGFKEMFSRYDAGSSDVQRIREGLQMAEVLLIDDILKGKPDERKGYPEVSKAVYDEMYGLIEYRHFHHKPTIWTSEYYYELIPALGEATASRLFEMSRPNIGKALYTTEEMLAGEIGKLNYRLRDI
ncbi:ATP-binding protein [Brevibacillus brevis]|uniref:ATP-binding protein n=1 Tax=Brevibacillus brevis TaxID=1393 RepID=UPI00165DBEF9